MRPARFCGSAGRVKDTTVRGFRSSCDSTTAAKRSFALKVSSRGICRCALGREQMPTRPRYILHPRNDRRNRQMTPICPT